jgi:hypothetical protein
MKSSFRSEIFFGDRKWTLGHVTETLNTSLGCQMFRPNIVPSISRRTTTIQILWTILQSAPDIDTLHTYRLSLQGIISCVVFVFTWHQLKKRESSYSHLFAPQTVGPKRPFWGIRTDHTRFISASSTSLKSLSLHDYFGNSFPRILSKYNFCW